MTDTMTHEQVIEAMQLETPAQAARLADVSALRDSAVYYASIGWPVFPLVPGGKAPLTSHGLHDASTDVIVVAEWWSRWPEANIGAPTGHRFDVIDIDAPEGFESFATLVAESKAAGHPAPNVLAAAYTGSGGRHLLVPPTGRGNAAGIRPGLDYRGRSGYIVAPPSRLQGGGLYSWVISPRPQLVTGAA